MKIKTNRITEEVEIPTPLLKRCEEAAQTAGVTVEALIIGLIERDVWQNAASKFPFLTAAAATAVDRICREFAVGPEYVVAQAVEQAMECFEEDIATNGGGSHGENEWGFVINAKLHAIGRPRRWDFKPKVGASFLLMFSHLLPKLEKEVGRMPKQIKRAA
jgi:hypothetical protein